MADGKKVQGARYKTIPADQVMVELAPSLQLASLLHILSAERSLFSCRQVRHILALLPCLGGWKMLEKGLLDSNRCAAYSE